MSFQEFKNETLFQARLPEHECRRVMGLAVRMGWAHMPPPTEGEVKVPKSKMQLQKPKTLDCEEFRTDPSAVQLFRRRWIPNNKPRHGGE